MKTGTTLVIGLMAATYGCAKDDTSNGPEPWGPNFVGVADDVGQDGPADVALGVFWDLDVASVLELGDGCFGVLTPVDAQPVGLDVGTLTVTGGSHVATQALTRNANGYYYLDGVADAWSAGDSISIVRGADTTGPVPIASPLTEHNLERLTEAKRSEDLVIEAGGSDGEELILSVQGQGATHGMLVGCRAPAADGRVVVPQTALAMFPSDVDTLHLKLQGGVVVAADDFSLVVSGQSVSADLPLRD